MLLHACMNLCVCLAFDRETLQINSRLHERARVKVGMRRPWGPLSIGTPRLTVVRDGGQRQLIQMDEWRAVIAAHTIASPMLLSIPCAALTPMVCRAQRAAATGAQRRGRRCVTKFETRAAGGLIASTCVLIALLKLLRLFPTALRSPADQPSRPLPVGGSPWATANHIRSHAGTEGRCVTGRRSARAPPPRRRCRQPRCSAGRHRGPASGRGAGDLPGAQEGAAESCCSSVFGLIATALLRMPPKCASLASTWGGGDPPRLRQLTPSTQSNRPLPVQVKPGEHVRVVGQPRVLGEWDTGRAPKLELVEPQSDLWAGTVEGLVTGAPFPFK